VPVPKEPQTRGGPDISNAAPAETPQQPVGMALPPVTTSASVAVELLAVGQLGGIGAFAADGSLECVLDSSPADRLRPLPRAPLALLPEATSASNNEEFRAIEQMDGGGLFENDSEERVLDSISGGWG